MTFDFGRPACRRHCIFLKQSNLKQYINIINNCQASFVFLVFNCKYMLVYLVRCRSFMLGYVLVSPCHFSANMPKRCSAYVRDVPMLTFTRLTMNQLIDGVQKCTVTHSLYERCFKLVVNDSS